MYKKFRKSKLIVTLCILFISLPLFIQSNTNLNPIQSEEKNEIKQLKTSGDYVGIIIDDLLTSNTTNAGNWTWAEEQPWCSGSGTLVSPYIIENHIWNMSMSIDGLKIKNSHNKYFVIKNCTFKWNELTNSMIMTGIYLLNTTHGQIIDNLAYHLGYGILLEDCENINITGNTIYDHIEGISFDNVDNSRLINNNCSNNDYGMYIKNECMNNTILGNTANNNADYGIYLYDSCNNNTISNNIANYNDYCGISLEYDCYYNTISGNTVNNNPGSGIYFYDSCGYNTISNNFVNSTGEEGISLHWYSSNNTIIDNIANYNGDIGIELYDYCENNTVLNNIVSFNGLNGIGIYDFSDNNNLIKNVLYNNSIGVYIDNSDNNTLLRNAFAKNGKHAYDDGIDNKWNSSTIGNYWDNHTSPDVSPLDGIVDNPYMYISGPAGSIDYLPIAEDGVPIIIINSPRNGNRFDSIAPSFNVEIIDVAIYEIWYTLDGGLNNYTFRLNGTINQAAWDALSNGKVTIRFYAKDVLGNVAFEEVTIVKGISAGGVDPGVVAAIVVVSVIGVTLVALVILVRKGKISLEKIKGFSFKRK